MKIIGSEVKILHEGNHYKRVLFNDESHEWVACDNNYDVLPRLYSEVGDVAQKQLEEAFWKINS